MYMYKCRNYIECNRNLLCYGIVNLDKLMLWYEPRYTWYNLCILSHIHVRVVGEEGQSGGICFLFLPPQVATRFIKVWQNILKIHKSQKDSNKKLKMSPITKTKEVNRYFSIFRRYTKGMLNSLKIKDRMYHCPKPS